MKPLSSTFKVASVLAIATLVLSVSARPASAGLFGRRTVIVNQGYPVYATPGPVVATYASPVSTLVTNPVYAAPVVGSAPLVDPALVPSTYRSPVIGSAPITTTYGAPVVGSAPLTTTYGAPVVGAAPVSTMYMAPATSVRVVYPRRAYRYYYGY